MNKILYITWKTSELCSEEKQRMDSWTSLNPDYELKFFDDQEMYEWMKNNTDEMLYKCFSQVVCGSAKADIFRYALLYKYGGVYIDIDCRCLRRNFLSSLESYSLVTCVDVFPRLIYQGFLFANKPGHQFFKNCLNNIVYSFENRKHQYDVFSFSGPKLAAEKMRSYCRRDSILNFVPKYYSSPNILLLSHNKNNVKDWIEKDGEKVIFCQEIVKDKRISGDYGKIYI